MINKFKTLLKYQMKSVGRDSILILLVVYPFLLSIMGKYIVPLIQKATLTDNFDLSTHYHVILVLFVIMTPFLYGDIAGLMLIDEREDNTLSAISVTPVKMPTYIFAKSSIFIFASIFTGVFITWFMDLYYIPITHSTIINIVASLGVPFNMLLINLFASNKVEGFTVMKITNIMLIVPMIGFYLPEPLRFIFGIVPAYWPSAALAYYHTSFTSNIIFFGHIYIGLIYITAITFIVYKLFKRKVLT